MKREIVLDTETTGLSPLQGHRVVEIGCVELINHLATGKTYHVYLNPQRDVPADASRVHGLTDEFLADKPMFPEIVDEFLAFIGDAPLVIHNAAFDMAFLNAELSRAGFPPLDKDRAIDTLMIARKKYFGAPATLDALCRRFEIDTSSRTLHGALLDSELLAEVYLELCGGRQPDLAIAPEPAPTTRSATDSADEPIVPLQRERRAPRPHAPTDEERTAHEAFLDKIKSPLWKRS